MRRQITIHQRANEHNSHVFVRDAGCALTANGITYTPAGSATLLSAGAAAAKAKKITAANTGQEF